MTRDEFVTRCDDLSSETKYSGKPWHIWLAEIADHDAEQRQTIEQQAQEIARLREALENIVEGEGLWTKNDMAHEAQQALKETGK